jgi:hypothetical protein
MGSCGPRRYFAGRFPGNSDDLERTDSLARRELRIELRALRARVGRVGRMDHHRCACALADRNCGAHVVSVGDQDARDAQIRESIERRRIGLHGVEHRFPPLWRTSVPLKS